MRLRGRRMMPLGVILKNAWDYKYQIIGIIIVTTLLTMIYTLKAQIAVKELSIARISEEKGKLEEQTKEQAASIISLQLDIETQNRAVQTMKGEAAKLKESIAIADKENKERDKRIKELLNRIYTNKPIPDDAKGQINWLRERAIENFRRGEPL